MANFKTKLVPIEDRTYAFALAIVRAFRANPPQDHADRVIWHQLLKSGTSAGANSAESRGAQSGRDWITRRFIALKEMRESLYWLRLLKDVNGEHTKGLEPLLDETNQLVAILTTVVKHAKENQKKAGG
ncbi:MAG: four helix bundle protein [Vicinamibacterales bacterium]